MDTKTRQYENFLRQELSHPITQEVLGQEKLKISGNLREGIEKRFDTPKQNALLFLHSSQDILGDTEFAIETFKKHISSNDRLHEGQMYLLIYGVLNAIYMQVQSFETLYETFNLDKKSSNLAGIKNLRILQLRHKVAAHPLNYGKANKAAECFRLIRNSVTNPEAIKIMNINNDIETFNLHTCLDEYSGQKELLLNNFITILIDKLYGDNSEKKKELLGKLQLITDGKLKSSTV